MVDSRVGLLRERLIAGANSALRPLGLSLNKLSVSKGFALHEYKKPDGSFDYERYRAVQRRGNLEKLQNVWVDQTNINFLADYIKTKIGAVNFGICHGTRRGLEQKWFTEALGCKVIGTEISETATQFENTIQWDFHDVKPEWLSSVDFIYSNSFDHSFDPGKCLSAWMSCLKPGGICLLEHTNAHGVRSANELDPFGAELAIMPYLVVTWSAGRFAVTDILKAPNGASTFFLCVRNLTTSEISEQLTIVAHLDY